MIRDLGDARHLRHIYTVEHVDKREENKKQVVRWSFSRLNRADAGHAAAAHMHARWPVHVEARRARAVLPFSRGSMDHACGARPDSGQMRARAHTTDHTSSHTHNAQTVRAHKVSPLTMTTPRPLQSTRPHHDRQFPVTCSYFVRGCSLRLGARVARAPIPGSWLRPRLSPRQAQGYSKLIQWCLLFPRPLASDG